jgi:hypothetical protein
VHERLDPPLLVKQVLDADERPLRGLGVARRSAWRRLAVQHVLLVHRPATPLLRHRPQKAVEL